MSCRRLHYKMVRVRVVRERTATVQCPTSRPVAPSIALEGEALRLASVSDAERVRKSSMPFDINTAVCTGSQHGAAAPSAGCGARAPAHQALVCR